ncbi:DNA replication ATP-dependent helicase/nuclease DNA2-like [Oratosquilla oratoria]|uniref:DNA replication ATP-dependent helicase/nuclease DNA2-like n=1 Tax=Oratosquilla oratoria TaxID=337810 RepID=UPI003F762533
MGRTSKKQAENPNQMKISSFFKKSTSETSLFTSVTLKPSLTFLDKKGNSKGKEGSNSSLRLKKPLKTCVEKDNPFDTSIEVIPLSPDISKPDAKKTVFKDKATQNEAHNQKTLVSSVSSFSENQESKMFTAKGFEKTKEKLSSKLKSSLVNNRYLNDITKSFKRPASHGTGVSPDGKRNNHQERERKPGAFCLDLTNRFDEVDGKSAELGSGNKNSRVCSPVKFSAISSKLSPTKGTCYSENKQENANELKKGALPSSQGFDIPDDDLCDFLNTCNNDNVKCEVKCKDPEDSKFSSHNGKHSNQKELESTPQKKRFCVGVSHTKEPLSTHVPAASPGVHSQDMFTDGVALEDMGEFDDNLTECFGLMSPFKEEPKKDVGKKLDKKILGKLDQEKLSKKSFAVVKNYGRHLVVEVERRPMNRDVLLHLRASCDHAEKTCSLSGLWIECQIKEGDIVNILNCKEVDNHFSIDNNQGLIIINPDYMMSGTSIVAGVFCRRKAILNEKFRGLESGNQVMIVGSLVHQLFQEVVKDNLINQARLQQLVDNLMSQSNMVRDMYGLELSEETVREEVLKYIPHIHRWANTYLKKDAGKFQAQPAQKAWNGRIEKIQDIEENLWSPKFGVKGKIDVTVEAKLGCQSKVMPLEIKTGRPSFSAEHKGQVILYSMMSSDRRIDPKSGLLLYLRDGTMEEVPARDQEQRGLIQLRNDLVHFLSPNVNPVEEDKYVLELPEPMDQARACSKCPHLLTCCLYQRVNNQELVQPPHAMAKFIPETTDHLQQSHLEYFKQWSMLHHLEIAENTNNKARSALWCADEATREQQGNCICNMRLDTSVCSAKELTIGQYSHTFLALEGWEKKSIQNIGLQVGDSVVISSPSEIALAQGVVLSFPSFSSISIVLDRDLYSYPSLKRRCLNIDRYEYESNMSICFVNLARLMQNSELGEALRKLIIERCSAEFLPGMRRDVVEKGRTILKPLNKEQQRFILRTLMAKNYILLKGYPGTGKTCTIVALVRLLASMGHSVLLTSYTHSAVDNILLKLKDHVPILRLGKASRIHPQILPYADQILANKYKSVADLTKFYNSQEIVATTCLGINHVIFKRRRFDYCIIDEASQVLQSAALGPIFCADRFVLVGDPEQLPPVVKSKQARKLGMGESLFSRLDTREVTVSLTKQYRMNGAIMYLSNCLTYKGCLVCASEQLEMAQLVLPRWQEEEATLLGWVRTALQPDQAVLLLDTAGGSKEDKGEAGMIYNVGETRIIKILVGNLLKLGMKQDNIGVIAPYRAQVKLLREVTQDWKDVEVNTVDQYQGRDKEVILYSCVRSGTQVKEAGEILQDARRLNVAITRAKFKLLFVGDAKNLQSLYTPFKQLVDILQPNQKLVLKEGMQDFMWSNES